MHLLRCLGALLALIAAFSLPRPASASECSMAQMLAAADSVIEPCTQLLKGSGLSKAKRAEALLIRGRGFHRSKRLRQAADDYRSAVELNPNNEEIWLAWSNVEQRRGEMDGYVEKVERAARIKPNSPRVLRAIGTMFWTFGDAEKAIEFFSKALAADPTEAFARLFRSDVYLEQSKFLEAIADADALVALPRDVINREGYLDPEGDVQDFYVIALIRRGQLLQEAGQDDRAGQDFDAAVAAGRTVPALIARARFLSRSGVSQEAIANLEEAVRKDPANASAQFALGVELTISQQFEQAFAAFDKAIAARPGFALAYKMRARMHRQFGRTEEAVTDFLTAIAANPSTIEQSIPALRYAGYWTSAQVPDSVTPELQDAIRACMIDTTCN